MTTDEKVALVLEAAAVARARLAELGIDENTAHGAMVRAMVMGGTTDGRRRAALLADAQARRS